MSDTDQIYAFPAVTLAHVPCPIEGCDRKIQIDAALMVSETDDQGRACFRLGTALNTNDLEFHMVEHGVNISGEVIE